MYQLYFTFNRGNEYNPKDFVYSCSNKQVLSLIFQSQQIIIPCMYIVLGDRCYGKTFICHLFKKSSENFFYIRGNSIQNCNLIEYKDKSIIVDDMDLMINNPVFDSFFFELYNLSISGYFPNVLMTARLHPFFWNMQREDNKTRLFSIPCVQLSQPCDKILYHVIKKSFSVYGFRVRDDIVKYMLNKFSRDISALKIIVAKIIDYCMENNNPLNMYSVRNVLSRERNFNDTV